METTIQQEILLMTGTSFSSRQCWLKKEKDNEEYVSESELLQDACCNGMLPVMLPEICVMNEPQKLFLWQIRENKSCIEIELGEYPEIMDKNFSIDPYSFQPFQLMN